MYTYTYLRVCAAGPPGPESCSPWPLLAFLEIKTKPPVHGPTTQRRGLPTVGRDKKSLVQQALSGPTYLEVQEFSGDVFRVPTLLLILPFEAPDSSLLWYMDSFGLLVDSLHESPMVTLMKRGRGALPSGVLTLGRFFGPGSRGMGLKFVHITSCSLLRLGKMYGTLMICRLYIVFIRRLRIPD